MESWTLKEMNLFHLWGLLLAKNRIFAFSLAFVCLHSHSAVSDSLQPHGLYPTRLLCPWDSPGKNTGVGCHFLLQGSFPTLGLKLHLLWLLHWQVKFLPLSHLESPLIAILGKE